MTSPDTTEASAQGNSDAPTAGVPFGPSEIISYIMALGAFLNGTLGNDYGLSKNAQALSILVAGLVVLGSTIARAIKHHGAMKANALVYAAQLQHVAAVVTASGSTLTVTSLAAGVNVLNTAVQADTGQQSVPAADPVGAPVSTDASTVPPAPDDVVPG